MVLSALIGGMLTFLAPCTLPLVPAYLSFIGGVSIQDINDKPALARRKAFINGLAFVAGFTIIFMIFGLLAGLLGHFLGGDYRVTLTHIGGIIIIIFGLILIGVLRIPVLQRTFKYTLPKQMESGKVWSSFLLGSAFAFGWSPCIGPILGTILTLAANSATVLNGAMLLFVYSLGLAIPFLLMALAIGSAVNLIKQINRYARIINLIAGIFLIFVGILLLTDNFFIIVQFIDGIFGPSYFDKLQGFV